MIKNSDRIPRKTKGQSLATYAQILANSYTKKTTLKYRKKRGQFFTPKGISEFMVRQFENINTRHTLRILILERE
jgi:type I restriction-modification system DNA methylase subunit